MSIETHSRIYTSETERLIGCAALSVLFNTKSFDVPKKIGSSPGTIDSDWEYVKNQLAIRNYLLDNGLNTQPENDKAQTMLLDHGVTKDDLQENLEDVMLTSRLVAAYEVTRPTLTESADHPKHRKVAA